MAKIVEKYREKKANFIRVVQGHKKYDTYAKRFTAHYQECKKQKIKAPLNFSDVSYTRIVYKVYGRKNSQRQRVRYKKNSLKHLWLVWPIFRLAFFSGPRKKKPDSTYLPTYDFAKSAFFNVPPRKKKPYPFVWRYI